MCINQNYWQYSWSVGRRCSKIACMTSKCMIKSIWSCAKSRAFDNLDHDILAAEMYASACLFLCYCGIISNFSKSWKFGFRMLCTVYYVCRITVINSSSCDISTSEQNIGLFQSCAAWKRHNLYRLLNASFTCVTHKLMNMSDTENVQNTVVFRKSTSTVAL